MSYNIKSDKILLLRERERKKKRETLINSRYTVAKVNREIKTVARYLRCERIRRRG